MVTTTKIHLMMVVVDGVWADHLVQEHAKRIATTTTAAATARGRPGYRTARIHASWWRSPFREPEWRRRVRMRVRMRVRVRMLLRVWVRVWMGVRVPMEWGRTAEGQEGQERASALVIGRVEEVAAVLLVFTLQQPLVVSVVG